MKTTLTATQDSLAAVLYEFGATKKSAILLAKSMNDADSKALDEILRNAAKCHLAGEAIASISMVK